MGVNIQLCNKHYRDAKIAETKANMNESNNRRDVDMYKEKTNLIGLIAKAFFSLVEAIMVNSGKKD